MAASARPGFFDRYLVSDGLLAEVPLDGFQNVCPIAAWREVALSIPVDDLKARGVVMQWDRHDVEGNRLHAAARKIVPKRLEHQRLFFDGNKLHCRSIPLQRKIMALFPWHEAGRKYWPRTSAQKAC